MTPRALPVRKVSLGIWSAASVTGGAAIGFACDYLLASPNTGFFMIAGLLAGVAGSTYLDERNRPGAKWRTALSALVLVWYVGLQIILKS